MIFAGPLAVLFAAFLWSLDSFLRQSLYAAPSFLVVTLEHLLGAILFLPFIVKYRGELKTFSKNEWISLAWVCLFGGILGTFFYTKALAQVDYVPLSVVVLLQKLQPFFAISLASFLLKERPSPRFLVLALVAVAGGYLITFKDVEPVLTGSGYAALLAIGAAFCWGSSTVFGKSALQKRSFFFVTALRLLCTAIFALIPLMLLSQQTQIASITPDQWKALLFIVFSTGAVALAIYYYGLKRVPASHATIYELMWPLSAIILDWFINKTLLTPTQYLGGALLLGAILLLPKQKIDSAVSTAQ